MQEPRFFLPLPTILRPSVNGMDGVLKAVTYTAILFAIAIKLSLTHPDNWSWSMLVTLYGGAAFIGAGAGWGNALQANRP